jgi:hypothetical protein
MSKKSKLDITYENRVVLPKTLKLSDKFTINEDRMKEWNIPKMVIEDDKHKDEPELWAYCKFNGKYKVYTKEKRYIVSTYGRIYDLYRRTLVSQFDSSGHSVVASGEKYKRVNINHANTERVVYSVHRLVALAFIPKIQGKPVIDHIDEHPSHNFVWNLQWVDKSTNSNKHNMYVERERTGKCVDTTWKYDELVQICKMMADGHKATYIYNKMLELTNNNPKIQYERIRTLYKHIMRRGDFHDIAVKCGVHFESNTLKEKGSVIRANERNNK